MQSHHAKGLTRLNTALSPGCRSEHSVNEDSSNGDDIEKRCSPDEPCAPSTSQDLNAKGKPCTKPSESGESDAAPACPDARRASFCLW